PFVPTVRVIANGRRLDYFVWRRAPGDGGAGRRIGAHARACGSGAAGPGGSRGLRYLALRSRDVAHGSWSGPHRSPAAPRDVPSLSTHHAPVHADRTARVRAHTRRSLHVRACAAGLLASEAVGSGTEPVRQDRPLRARIRARVARARDSSAGQPCVRWAYGSVSVG